LKKTSSHAIFSTLMVLWLVACAPVATGTGQADIQTPQSPSASPTLTGMPCMILHVPVTPAAFGAQFDGRGHVSGPADAPVTIVVFIDYQCPACAYLAANLKQIRLIHPRDVRLVSINTPMLERDKDTLAVQAAEAADLQGKFWEMNDLLFEKQSGWINLAPAEFEAWAVQQAGGLGLDTARFQTDFEGRTVADRLQRIDQSAANQPITPPILFVNGTSPYTGLADFPSLDSVIRMDALTVRQFSSCPLWMIDPLKQYFATLHTTKGDAVIQLFPDKAPLAVNNFVFLARQGWYDGITFHRVIPNQIIQSGDPSGTGIGNPGYLFETEIPSGLNFDRPGLIAMDNSGVNTNGSLFFITLASANQLNGMYTIFGQVISGMEVLSGMTPRDPKPGDYLPPGDELISVTIQER
jgi:cyclophilin family peptidyl-prolyl cis-trans isomerase/protein-disulfide isomerase